MPQAFTSPSRVFTSPVPSRTSSSGSQPPKSLRMRSSRKSRNAVPELSPEQVAEHILERNDMTSPIIARLVLDQHLDGRALAAFAEDSDSEDRLASESVIGGGQLAEDFLRVTSRLREKLHHREVTSRNRPSAMEIAMELEAHSPHTTTTSAAATPPLTPSPPDWDLDDPFDAEELEVFAPQQEADDEDEIAPLATPAPTSPSLSYHSAASPRLNLPIILDSDTSFIPGDLSLLSALGTLRHHWPSSSTQLGDAGQGDRLVEERGGLLSRHRMPSSSLFSTEEPLNSSVVSKPSHLPIRTPSKPTGRSIFGELDQQPRKPRRASCPPRPHLRLKHVPDEFFTTPSEPARMFSDAEVQTDNPEPANYTPTGDLVDLSSDNEDLEPETTVHLPADLQQLDLSLSVVDANSHSATEVKPSDGPLRRRHRLSVVAPTFISMARTASEPRRSAPAARRPTTFARTRSYTKVPEAGPSVRNASKPFKTPRSRAKDLKEEARSPQPDINAGVDETNPIEPTKSGGDNMNKRLEAASGEPLGRSDSVPFPLQDPKETPVAAAVDDVSRHDSEDGQKPHPPQQRLDEPTPLATPTPNEPVADVQPVKEANTSMPATIADSLDSGAVPTDLAPAQETSEPKLSDSRLDSDDTHEDALAADSDAAAGSIPAESTSPAEMGAVDPVIGHAQPDQAEQDCQEAIAAAMQSSVLEEKTAAITSLESTAAAADPAPQPDDVFSAKVQPDISSQEPSSTDATAGSSNPLSDVSAAPPLESTTLATSTTQNTAAQPQPDIIPPIEAQPDAGDQEPSSSTHATVGSSKPSSDITTTPPLEIESVAKPDEGSLIAEGAANLPPSAPSADPNIDAQTRTLDVDCEVPEAELEEGFTKITAEEGNEAFEKVEKTELLEDGLGGTDTINADAAAGSDEQRIDAEDPELGGTAVASEIQLENKQLSQDTADDVSSPVVDSPVIEKGRIHQLKTSVAFSRELSQQSQSPVDDGTDTGAEGGADEGMDLEERKKRRKEEKKRRQAEIKKQREEEEQKQRAQEEEKRKAAEERKRQGAETEKNRKTTEAGAKGQTLSSKERKRLAAAKKQEEERRRLVQEDEKQRAREAAKKAEEERVKKIEEDRAKDEEESKKRVEEERAKIEQEKVAKARERDRAERAKGYLPLPISIPIPEVTRQRTPPVGTPKSRAAIIAADVGSSLKGWWNSSGQ